MKNQFEKALKAKKAHRAKQAAKPNGEKSRGLERRRERTEEIKNGKVISSTRADNK